MGLSYRSAVGVMALGTVLMSCDAPLIRLSGSSPFVVVFWCGLGMWLVGGVVGMMRRQAPGGDQRRWLWLAAGILSVGQLSFAVAVTSTVVANVVLMLSVAPLLAAGIDGVVYRQPTHRHTLIASGCSMVGIAIMGQDSLSHEGGVIGLLAAFACALAMAGLFCVLKSRPDISVPGIMWRNGFLSTLAMVGLLPQVGSVVPGSLGALVALGLLALVTMPSSRLLQAWSAQHIPGAVSCLLVLLEAVVAPLLVWLAVDEVPSREAFLGGAVILSALVWHARTDMRFQGLLETSGGR